MRKRNVLLVSGMLAVMLVFGVVLAGCASAAPVTPSPFEGGWVAKDISQGNFSGLASASTLLFEGNRMSIGLRSGAMIMIRNKFTFTDTEIIADGQTFKYTLNEEGLTTEDDLLGKIFWVKR
jgi:hypothetical protein